MYSLLCFVINSKQCQWEWIEGLCLRWYLQTLTRHALSEPLTIRTDHIDCRPKPRPQPFQRFSVCDKPWFDAWRDLPTYLGRCPNARPFLDFIGTQLVPHTTTCSQADYLAGHRPRIAVKHHGILSMSYAAPDRCSDHLVIPAGLGQTSYAHLKLPIRCIVYPSSTSLRWISYNTRCLVTAQER